MVKLINLTPHALNVITPSGVITVPPSGAVARVSSTPATAGEVAVDGGIIPLSRTTFGEVVGLPAPEEGVLLVVSAIVRERVPHRGDVASPGALVRGEDGQPVGCQGLTVN